VAGKGNFAMTTASIATCAKVLLDRKDQGEIPSGVLGVDDVFDLAEVRAGFETQGIRIVALSYVTLQNQEVPPRAVLVTTLLVVEPFHPHRSE
jgi:hypothetical protein